MKIKSNRELLVKSFVQTVSSATTFNKRYKKVCTLLDSRPDLTSEEWIYIWRGLYYTVWYTEMGKGFEELALKIASSADLTMILTGFQALTNDWFGIDAIRIDKYMFLVRVMINNCIKLEFNHLINHSSNDISIDSNVKQLNAEIIGKVDEEVDDKTGSETKTSTKDNKNKKFRNKKEIKEKVIQFPIEFRAELIDNILSIVKSSIGLTLHITDIFIDELIKVINEMKPNLKVEEKINLYYNYLLPFAKLMAITDDYRVRDNIKQNIFDKLINDIIISESINTRKTLLEMFCKSMTAIGSVEEINRKNRDLIYNMVKNLKNKMNLLNGLSDGKGVKRKKIVVKSGKHKKVRYETTSVTPFVRSIVPIAVL